MSIRSVLVGIVAALIATYLIVFAAGIAAALLGAPQPLADLLSVVIGASFLLGIVDAVMAR